VGGTYPHVGEGQSHPWAHQCEDGRGESLHSRKGGQKEWTPVGLSRLIGRGRSVGILGLPSSAQGDGKGPDFINLERKIGKLVGAFPVGH